MAASAVHECAAPAPASLIDTCASPRPGWFTPTWPQSLFSVLGFDDGSDRCERARTTCAGSKAATAGPRARLLSLLLSCDPPDPNPQWILLGDRSDAPTVQHLT
ncbi:hypothetical protein ACJJTC_013006 [Scirpophaga incertulas]